MNNSYYTVVVSIMESDNLQSANFNENYLMKISTLKYPEKNYNKLFSIYIYTSYKAFIFCTIYLGIGLLPCG